MKIIILLYSILNFAYFVLSEGDLKRCADQCPVIYECYYGNGGTTGKNIPMWPVLNSKQPAITKCYCTKPDVYRKCLDCYFSFKPDKNPSDAELNTQCKLVSEQNVAVPASSAPAAPATVASTATNVAGATKAVNKAKATVASTTTNSIVPTNNSQSSNNQTIQTENKENDNKSNGSNKTLTYAVIGCVAAVGVIGLLVYNKKKNSRPESMPFYGNNVSSNQFATLNVPKNNHTMGYNASSFNTLPNNGYNTLSGGNDYYAQNNYNYNQTPTYENQYGQYQDYQYQQQPYSSPETMATTMPATPVVPVAATATAAVATGINNNQASETTTNNINPNNSVSYDTRRESMNVNPSVIQSSEGNALIDNNIYTCTFPYNPQLEDELELKLNDKVQIIEKYADDWMKAKNLTSGKEGMAPQVCIRDNNN